MTGTALPRAIDLIGWQFDNSYARLPQSFFGRVLPAPVSAPAVVLVNHRLADSLGLDTRALSSSDAAALFAGQVIPEGADPLAQAYAGHQFGGFTILGDGRAILLGEHRTPRGDVVDVQFKGSGPTPYSRRGDGRAALGPMLREYVISEAMHGLGIPTTRSLAVVTTGDPVYRDRELRGAVLTRVASSHLRVGTFEFFAAHRDADGLRTLAEYAVARHYPELAAAPNLAIALLDAVITRQASLVAQWMCVGFVHGVMNTDNVAISGESIDYGPCAFMDRYDPDTVFSSIDMNGRYAYGQQPAITQWNLTRFAEALLPLIDADRPRAIAMATESLETFPARFEQAWLSGMRSKLGLMTARPGDTSLVQDLLGWMHQRGADFTNTFRALSVGSAVALDDAAFSVWERQWHVRLAMDGSSVADAGPRMRAANPAVIARNHAVEAALAAAEHGSLGPLDALLSAIARPYEDGAHHDGFREPGAPDAAPYRTFCGT